MAFCDWLFFLGMFLRFIHATACISASFPLMAEEASTVWTDHILLVHSSIERHLGYVHILARTTSAPLNMHTQVFAWVPVFNSLG